MSTIFHRLHVNSIQLSVLWSACKPLNLIFHASMDSRNRCMLPRLKNGIGEYKDFCCWYVDCFVSFVLPFAKHVCADQSSIYLEVVFELWSASLSHRSTVLSFVAADFWKNVNLHRILSKKNCCIQRCRHKHSPYPRIHIEVIHVVSWFATNFLSQIRVGFLKMWDASNRYLEIVWPQSQRRRYLNLQPQVSPHLLESPSSGLSL